MAKFNKKQEDTTDNTKEDLAAALLLKDVEETMRQERMHALWAEWGSTVIGVAFMMIFGTIIGVSWQAWRSSVQTEQTTKLITVADGQGDYADQLSGSYKGIAAMMKAAQLAEGGADVADVVNKHLTVAAESGLPREWDVLAQWGVYRTKADMTTDAAARLEIADEIASLATQRKNPYSPMMLMEAAILKGENGKEQEAVSMLEQAKTYDAVKNIPVLAGQINVLESLYKNGASAQ